MGLGGKAFSILALAAALLLGAPAAEAAITCVPYARKESGLKLYGDAWTWWGHAAGKYARGQKPRAGSVLVFEQSGAMRHGHVAVVKKVFNSRQILVDHANWGGPGVRKGAIYKNVAVLDTSPRNDWTSVRVWYQPGRDFGVKDYPTYGFVHGAAAAAGDDPDIVQKPAKAKAKAATVKARAPVPTKKPARPPVEAAPQIPLQIAERPDVL